jgi:hypothetical protein
MGNDIICVPGYTWMGHNRATVHIKACKGSGGVGFLIRNELHDSFDISVLDDSYEDILWITLTHRITREMIHTCVCYLAPHNSTRIVNANDFFDKLLTQVYTFQNDGLIFICADFNARMGDTEEFIAGIDSLPPRDVVDFQKNGYCEPFTDFMISTSTCMLNGRNCLNNDFTSISSRGTAVVDYCVVPYEQLDMYPNFQVIRSRDLMTRALSARVLDRIVIPDHSVLVWDVCVSPLVTERTSCEPPVSFTKYDREHMPYTFMCDEDILRQLQDTIGVLESSDNSQCALDIAYSSFCDIVKGEMDRHMSPKVIVLNGASNRKRRRKKPWWTDELTVLWNELCVSERKWTKATSQVRKRLKTDFIQTRKVFDQNVQKRKRQYWRKQQEELITIQQQDTREFWKRIGRIGVGSERTRRIPMEVVMDDGSVSRDTADVLHKWKSDFQVLLNSDNPVNNTTTPSISSPTGNGCPVMDGDISVEEIGAVVVNLRRGKSVGIDELPSETLQSANVILFLHKLFNMCFVSGKMPTLWSKGIIQPIPKSSTTDVRDPLSYRGITLASCVYKIFCGVINNRLTTWAEENELIADNQNGFRKQRSTIDHLSTLTSIVETRKKKKLSTFVGFIDFRKAYDRIDRPLLWSKLSDIGVGGKMFACQQSLYNNLQCCLRINGRYTDWFEVNCGLKQGCVLSPVLFNLYVNSLSQLLNEFAKGVDIDGTIINNLFYADDLVLIAENEKDLQAMFDLLSGWCADNKMCVNMSKSKVVHFRNPSVNLTTYQFTCSDQQVEIVDSYCYLGLVLSQHLDYAVTAKAVAKSANITLGLLIAKCKLMGGLPYETFTKLYDSTVWATISYGAAIWGTAEFSCINAVQNRACRYFLGVGKYTPNAAVSGEMGWLPLHIRQWKTVVGYWSRMTHMNVSRLNRSVFAWANRVCGTSCKNWHYRVKTQMNRFDIDIDLDDIDVPLNKKSTQRELEESMFASHCIVWKGLVERDSTTRGSGNKLRTYKLFKRNYEAEQYVKCVMSKQQRSALAKFRCGVAPLRLETGRYEHLPVHERLCFNCNDCVEDELHVLIVCPLYDSIRGNLFNVANEVNADFSALTDSEKLCFTLSHKDLLKASAKTCLDILNLRRSYLYR